MSAILELLSASMDFCSLGAAEKALVEEAEKRLGLSFANEFKEYVMAYGAVAFEDHELTGICESERLSVISTTERARSFYPCFPPKMYVVEEMYYDHVLTTQDETGTIYSYGPKDEAKRIASSLQEYLFPDSINTALRIIEPEP